MTNNNSTTKIINVDQWIQENQSQFLPPVCNKLMHNDQLTIMFVGGPNIRQDFHFEEGEEFFYQVKGDMCLKVIEQNEHRDIIIKEGDVFLLPGRIPHSPNRFENTVGFVMERRRDDDEVDCLRYYQERSTHRLFERWFHTTDLGQQLVPVIKEFFQSEEYRTGKPKSDSFPAKPLLNDDNKTHLGQPFSLNEWIDKHRDELNNGNAVSLFPDRFQTRVFIFGKGQHAIECSTGDVWLWQLKGHGKGKVCRETNDDFPIDLQPSDSIYLNVHWKAQLNIDHDGLVLAVSQDPKRKRA